VKLAARYELLHDSAAIARGCRIDSVEINRAPFIHLRRRLGSWQAPCAAALVGQPLRTAVDTIQGDFTRAAFLVSDQLALVDQLVEICIADIQQQTSLARGHGQRLKFAFAPPIN
jgi:hypothetical protein